MPVALTTRTTVKHWLAHTHTHTYTSNPWIKKIRCEQWQLPAQIPNQNGISCHCWSYQNVWNPHPASAEFQRCCRQGDTSVPQWKSQQIRWMEMLGRLAKETRTAANNGVCGNRILENGYNTRTQPGHHAKARNHTLSTNLLNAINRMTCVCAYIGYIAKKIVVNILATLPWKQCINKFNKTNKNTTFPEHLVLHLPIWSLWDAALHPGCARHRYIWNECHSHPPRVERMVFLRTKKLWTVRSSGLIQWDPCMVYLPTFISTWWWMEIRTTIHGSCGYCLTMDFYLFPFVYLK